MAKELRAKTEPARQALIQSVMTPVLDAQTRTRLGRQLRALYDPVIDEMLDPRLAELLQQLDADRADETGR